MSEIVRRLEYIARVLDTPPYNTPDEVKAIREAIDSINRYDSLVAEVEMLRRKVAFLECLEACGVDSWEGYSDACEMMDEEVDEG